MPVMVALSEVIYMYMVVATTSLSFSLLKKRHFAINGSSVPYLTDLVF